MRGETEFTFPATFGDVAQATPRIRAALPGWMEPEELDAVELALAEALTNIVEHGWGGDCPDQSIRLRVTDLSGALQVDVWDQGRPIPAGKLEQADDTTFQYDPTDLAQLPEGGMGLALIKSAFHEVRYRRKGGINRLHLVRRI